VGAVDSRERRVGCEFRFFGKFFKAEVYERK
jgi:hypothetical protein